MLEKNQIMSASQTLHDHWRAGTKLAALEDWHRPNNRAEGYAIQAAIERYSTTHLFGWKIAATSEAGQKHINVPGPMAGRILAETVIPDGGTANMAGNEMRVAEPEFAFRMKSRFAGAIGALHDAAGAGCGRHAASGDRDSGFALCGFCRRRRSAAHCRQRLRASVRARPGNDGGLAFARSRRGKTCDHMRGQQFIGHGKNVLGDPRIALTWLANELRQLGATLKAGRVVTTGTCHPPLPIAAGDFFAADFGVLGKVSVGFALETKS